MSGLKSMQKRTRLRLAATRLMLGTVVVSLVGVLVGLVPLETVVGSLVGGMALALMKTWAVDRDIARLAALAKKEKNEPGLIMPLGANLRAALHFIYSPKTAERVFDQIIADMRVEWIEATKKDQQWLARWIQVRGVLTVFFTVAAHTVTTLRDILKLVR